MLDKTQYKKLFKVFVDLGEEGLYLSHYELALHTEYNNVTDWKDFLMDPRTVDYVTSEMNIIRSAAINSMVAKAPNSNSVGQSQLINALQKLDEKAVKKEGPVFIYSYVPLNNQQKQAPNVRTVNAEGVEQIGENTWIIS